MAITLQLSAEVKKRLTEQAKQRGLSLQDYLKEVVTREANLPPTLPSRAGNLSDMLLRSPFAGANLDLERRRDFPLQIEFD
jgi:hypothetical protein